MLAWLLHFAVLQNACSGHRRCAPMLKIVPVDFLHFAVLQNACSGHRRCAPMLKIVPVDFFKKNTSYSKNR
jgi:hypothetical protein